jgi:hypothetical protein
VADHDVEAFAHSLSAKLASRSRHVCVFLGAGASRAAGLPDVAALQSLVLAGLTTPQRMLFTKQLAGRTLEQALSRVRRIAALVEGTDTIDGLTRTGAGELDAAVCREIVAALDVAAADLQYPYSDIGWLTNLRPTRHNLGGLQMTNSVPLVTSGDGTAAVVTGAATGIGRHLATALAARGVPVTAMDADDRTLRAWAQDIERVYSVGCDVTDEARP